MTQDNAVRVPARSFIVRTAQDDSRGRQLRGEIEAIATGEQRVFIDGVSLLECLENLRSTVPATS